MSRIEWTDRTWNPVTGCTKVSAGCQNCYAERMAKRLAGRYGYPDAPNQFDVTLHEDKLKEPLRWKKPQRIFVCSMGDLFHEGVPFDFVGSVFGIMSASQHTFLILTKRPDRMREFMRGWSWVGQTGVYIQKNIQFGVSISNQDDADRIIPILLDTPAAVRFVSYEPTLGPVDFSRWLTCWVCSGSGDGEGGECPVCYGTGTDAQISWLIAGCESGPNRRPCDIDWIRDVRDQCVAADIPFFLKQLEVDGKLVKMPELDGRVWDQMPERRL